MGKNGMQSGRWCFVLAIIAAVSVAAAQTVAGGLSADLSRYYFSTPAAELAARADLDRALEQLSHFGGQFISGAQLLGALRAYDSVQELFTKHENYLHFLCALDRKSSACDAQHKLEAEVDAKTAFLRPEILAIPEDRLRTLLSQEPALAHYQFELTEMRKDAPYLLPAAEEALLGEFQPEIADWQYGLYQQIVAGIPFEKVETGAGPLDVIRQRSLIAASTDGKVREQGFKRRYSGFASQRDLLAFALIHTARAQNLLATSHHYPDAPSKKYLNLDLDPGQTRTLLELMAKHGDIPIRYEKIRAFDFERDYREPCRAWDISAPSPAFVPPLVSLAGARNVFHEAFSGLGAEYQSAFDGLLDPANGRADILPGGAPNRYAGGFSIGSTGTDSILFFGRFDGTFKDLSVIAHEGGHAVHRQFMSSNHVLATYSHGPNYLFESFAEFNELLLADYMADHAQQPKLSRYYHEQWLGIKGLDAFYGADDAVLEQAIYDGIAASTVRNADDLDKLTIQIDGQFSQFPAVTPEMRTRWAMVSLMYEDPLYDVNYVYGGLLALKYYQLYTTRREWFVPRYIALLKNGFNEPPGDLLKRFLEIDLSGPGLLNDDLVVLGSRLDQLDRSTHK